MSYQDIIVETVESWVEITLHRPEKLNALREQTSAEISEVLAHSENEHAIAVVILQGNSTAFCTGIDVSEFPVREGEYFDFYRRRRRSWRTAALFRDLPSYTKPIITCVEGSALGGGLELALLSDIIVAGANAQFGLPELRLGIMPGGGGTQTLPRLIGLGLAKELIWTGRRIDAREAREYHLVNHVTEAGKALEKSREIARAISRNAPLPIMLSKAAINRSADLPLAEGMACELDASSLLYFSDDRKEGLAAFRAKRDPVFRGR